MGEASADRHEGPRIPLSAPTEPSKAAWINSTAKKKLKAIAEATGAWPATWY